MYNNQFNQPQYGAMGYNPQYQTPVMTNALTADEIKELRKVGSTNVIPQVSREELLASKCTHRDPQTNTFATVPANQEGYVTCTLCRKTFRPTEMTEAQAESAVNAVIDIAQTAKMNFLDMAPNAVSEYFKMLPLLERLPKIYAQSLNNFNKYDSGMQYQQNSTNNYFNMLSALTSPTVGMGNYAMNGGYAQQPMNGGYGMYQQQPMGYGQQQQPMGYPQQQVPMQQNAFYQQPNQMQAMTTAQPQQQPQQQAAPNQPSVPSKPEVKAVINA